jgi:hypothetical protein
MARAEADVDNPLKALIDAPLQAQVIEQMILHAFVRVMHTCVRVHDVCTGNVRRERRR